MMNAKEPAFDSKHIVIINRVVVLFCSDKKSPNNIFFFGEYLLGTIGKSLFFRIKKVNKAKFVEEVYNITISYINIDISSHFKPYSF